MVLDFANEAEEIKAAFEPYYETTLLSEATDPNLLYEIQSRLPASRSTPRPTWNAFAKVYFDPKATQDRLYAVLRRWSSDFEALPEEEQHDFRGQLTDYVRLYAFLAQVLTFADADLEKLYVFARHLRRLLPADRTSCRARCSRTSTWSRTGSSRPAAARSRWSAGRPARTTKEQGTLPTWRRRSWKTLSRIIAELNERFGLNLGPEHASRSAR